MAPAERQVRRWFVTAIAALALLHGACARNTSPAAHPARGAVSVYPAAEWESITDPAAAGWRQADLDAIRARLETMPTTGFLAIAGGRVLLSYGDVQSVSYLASVRKSILAMLFGTYVASGTVNLDKTLAEIGIDDIGGLTPEEKSATVRHLLTARSGIYHQAANAGDDLESAPPHGSQKPGTYYLYSNWDFNALGTIFENETGRDIYDALESDLAQPIGMQDFDRSIHRKSGNAQRSQHLAYHMHLSTRDMARVGYLMLREGKWSSRQVVPAGWVREITRAFTRVGDMNPESRRKGPFGYGYLWWVWDGPFAAGPYRGAYTGLGAVGQHITVIPVLDLVVAHKTRPGDGRSVTHAQYLSVLDELVQAGCRARAC